MFDYTICVPDSFDIDELINKWNKDSKIVNYFHRNFTAGQYALINFIVNEGLMDVRGQQIADDPIIDDDPYARPDIDNPNLNPGTPSDEDPYSRPSGWDPSSGIFYDPDTGNLINKDGEAVDKDGNVIGPNESKLHPLWEEWNKYWNLKYPMDQKVPEEVPEYPSHPEYEDFYNWLKEMVETGYETQNPEPENPPNEDDYVFTTPDADIDNPNWKMWVAYCKEVHPDWFSIPHTPRGKDDPDYEGFVEYLKQHGILELPSPYWFEEESIDHTYWNDWYDYWLINHPTEYYIPNVPEDESSSDWEAFMEYLASKYDNGNEGIEIL